MSDFLMVAVVRAPRFLPAAVNRVLFETQALWWVAAIVAAAILLHLGRSRADRKMMMAGVIVGMATLLWIAAAWLVVTPGERLYAAHQGLAAAATRGDVGGILAYCGEEFAAPALGIDSRGEALTAIGDRLERFGIRDNHITTYRVEFSEEAEAVTTVTLLTETGEVGPVRTTWRLTWSDVAGKDWRIERAELVKAGDGGGGL